MCLTFLFAYNSTQHNMPVERMAYANRNVEHTSCRWIWYCYHDVLIEFFFRKILNDHFWLGYCGWLLSVCCFGYAVQRSTIFEFNGYMILWNLATLKKRCDSKIFHFQLLPLAPKLNHWKINRMWMLHDIHYLIYLTLSKGSGWIVQHNLTLILSLTINHFIFDQNDSKNRFDSCLSISTAFDYFLIFNLFLFMIQKSDAFLSFYPFSF